jgi:hypothetical protein
MEVLNNKDVVRKILCHVEDTELLKVCSINRRWWNIICDENFLRRRLGKYPDIEKYRDERSYKNFFSWISFLVSEMKTKYNFSYIEGDIRQQHNLLNTETVMNDLLLKACHVGELSIVKYAIDKGGYIHYSSDEALYRSGFYAHFEIVKYLTLTPPLKEFYADTLRTICRVCKDKHFLIVKHLVEYGIDHNIDIGLDISLGSVCESGHLDTIKYLIEKGADKFHPYVVRMSQVYGATAILKNL